MGKVFQENGNKGRTSMLALGKMDSKAKIISMIEKAKIDIGTTRQCRGHGFNLWSGKILHATEPALEPRSHSYRGLHAWLVLRSKGCHALQCRPAALAANRESPHRSCRDPGQPKINK